MYLDGIYRSSNGSDLGQWSFSGSTAQQWTLGTVGYIQVTKTTAAPAAGQGMVMNDQPNAQVQLFPNPFASTFNLTFADPGAVKSIAIFDLAGRQVELIGHSAVAGSMTVGASLNPGADIIKV